MGDLICFKWRIGREVLRQSHWTQCAGTEGLGVSETAVV